MRTYAISDIHGHYKQFQSLLGYINYKDNEDRMIFLGDMIDRGPDSRLVMELLLELGKAGRHVFLRGNHEEFVLSLAEGSSASLYTWLNEGGRACMRSYGISDDYIESVGVNYFYRVRDHNRQFVSEMALSDPKQMKAFIRMVFPTEHLRLMRSMPDKHESGDYLFVHEHYGGLQTDRIVISGHEHLIRPFVGPKRVCIGLSNQRVCALDMDSLVATDSEGITYDCPMDIILGPESKDYYRPQMGAWEI
jgi:calcineurin-like phosphoesterase family protein